MARARPRRWLQFNLRHLLLIVVAVALLLAWWKPLRKHFHLAVRAAPDGTIASIHFDGRLYATTEQANAALSDSAQFRMVNPEDAVLWITVDESLEAVYLDELLSGNSIRRFVVSSTAGDRAFRLNATERLPELGSPAVDSYPPLLTYLRADTVGDLVGIEVGEMEPAFHRLRTWDAFRKLIEEEFIANAQPGDPDLTFNLNTVEYLRVGHLLDALEVCCAIRDLHPNEAFVRIATSNVAVLGLTQIDLGGLDIPFTQGPGHNGFPVFDFAGYRVRPVQE